MVGLTSIALLAAAATSPQALAEPLAPLQFLVEHCWAAKVGKDASQTDTHCFAPMYGGKHLRDTHTVTDAAGKTVYGGETIYAWNGKTKRIEFSYFSADGGVSHGGVAPKDGVLDFGDETFTGPDGKQIRIATEWRRDGDNAYQAISRSAFMPTGQRVTRYVRLP